MWPDNETWETMGELPTEVMAAEGKPAVGKRNDEDLGRGVPSLLPRLALDEEARAEVSPRCDWTLKLKGKEAMGNSLSFSFDDFSVPQKEFVTFAEDDLRRFLLEAQNEIGISTTFLHVALSMSIFCRHFPRFLLSCSLCSPTWSSIAQIISWSPSKRLLSMSHTLRSSFKGTLPQ